MQLSDWQYTGTSADFNWANVWGKDLTLDKLKDNNASISEDSTFNWLLSKAKSFTDCNASTSNALCPGNAEKDMKGGSGINAHWFRNFSTDDADGYDLKLTEADVDKQYEAFGFLWAWTKSKDYLANLDDIEQKKKPTG